MDKNPLQSYSSGLRYAILLLFFIQSAGMLVESIYILDLMNTRLDEKAAGILFFFAPALLLLFRRSAPVKLSWIAALALFFGRGVAPYLDTGGRLLAAGVATGAALVLLPVWLREPHPEGSPRTGRAFSQGFALALGLSVLLRTLNYSIDLSLEPGGAWIGWGLGLVWLGMIFMERKGDSAQAGGKSGLPGSVKGTGTGAVCSAPGIFSILALGYLAFFSPGVIARGTEGSYTLIVSSVSLLALLWLWFSMNQARFLERSKRLPCEAW